MTALPRSVVAVVGNPQSGSRTAAAATATGERIGALIGATVTATIDLADLGPSLLARGDPSVAAAKEVVLGATVAVIASPTYKAAYTGLLKLFLDQFEKDELRPLAAVVPLMTGGSPAHSLAVEVHLRPVLVEIGGAGPTRGLYLSGAQIDDPGPAIEAWLETAGPHLVASAGPRPS